MLLILVIGVVIAVDPSFAQTNPFGGPRLPTGSSPGSGGIVGWILQKQNEFYRQFSGLIRAAKSDGRALWWLMSVSFLYGVFHAAGPGHGKAVIASYLVANEETWRRGIVLSFASALLQALVAIMIVGVAAGVLQASRQFVCDVGRMIEIASYSLIGLLGARLTWIKGAGFLRTLTAVLKAHSYDERHRHNKPSGHAHHGHEAGGRCGHTHGPELMALAGPGGWRRGLTAILAVGLRPCSGGILVLVFALAQGLFWAGVLSTFVMGVGTALTVAAIATLTVGAKGVAVRLATSECTKGLLLFRGIELVAAVLVLVFGFALLAGYMGSERLVMVC